MSDTKQLKILFDCARREPKSNYTVYNVYIRQIQDLNLDPKEYTEAVKKLCRILQV